MRRLSRFVLVGLVVLGCGSAGPSASPSAGPTTSGPSPSASSNGPSPSASVRPTQPDPGGLALGSVVEVVTDDLRVRSAPAVSETSTILEPLLEPGTKLYVVDGPVGASGYAWYQVLTFSGDLTPAGGGVDETAVEGGWVAAADKNGEPWVQAFRPDCAPAPTSVNDLLMLDGVTALACFGGQPLTLAARMLDCRSSPELQSQMYCEADTGSPAYSPGWFDRTFAFLVPEAGSFDQDSMLDLHLDPLGSYPAPMPYGVPVDVTGQYDHPAASACTVYHYFKEDTPSVQCRTVFAVTAVASR